MFIQIASAAPAAQMDLLASSIHRLSGYDREIVGAWLQQYGTAAITTIGAVDLYVSDVNVASLIGVNTGTTGAAGTGDPAGGLNLIPVDAEVPAGAEIRAIVTTAPAGATNLVISIQIDEDLEEDDGGMMAAMGL